jgi:GDPmannose 4,6-dehydratase
MTVNYREAYGIHASNGILFNHESPRRGATFVTRKITRAVAHILAGKQDKVYLGNLESRRDWGYAPEYVEGMWRMLQQDQPADYVLGTGESHSIREFVEEAFGYVRLEWQKHVGVDERYKRPSEVDFLLADASKAERELGWMPKICFRELVRIMIDADMEAIGLEPIGEGKRILKERFGDWHQWTNSVTKNFSAVAGAVIG